MKIKQLVAVLAAAFAVSAMAEPFVGVSYNPSVKNETTKQVVADSTSLTLGNGVFGNMFVLDGKVDATRARTGGNLTDAAQARATVDLPLFGYGSAFVRGGLGRSWTAGNDYNFYTYAAGAKANLPQNFNVFGNAERNNAMKAGNPHFTTYTVGVGYDVTKKDEVSLGWQRAKGDVNTSGFQVGYNHKF